MLQLNNVMDLKEKRKLAKDVLEDNMSESTSEHINKVDYLTNWIIDAMIEFSDKVNNGVLDDVSNCQHDGLYNWNPTVMAKECLNCGKLFI